MIEYSDIITIVLSLITIARVIVRLTPSKKDDGYFIRFMKLVETLGLPDIKDKVVRKK